MTGLYAYALVGDGTQGAPSVEGVAPGRLGLVAGGGMAAVVGPVDVTEFEGARLEENLARPDWLEGVVRAHEAVVEAVAYRQAALPMRFGSIFSDELALREMLEANSRALTDLLDQVGGRVELGVTVRADQRALVEDVVGAETPDSGRQYLRRRQREQRAAEEVGSRAAELADRVHRALAAAAERATVLTPRRHDRSIVLSAAYLVPADGLEAFCLKVDGVGRAEGSTCRLDLTGPWPPYSFVSVDVSGPGA